MNGGEKRSREKFYCIVTCMNINKKKLVIKQGNNRFLACVLDDSIHIIYIVIRIFIIYVGSVMVVHLLLYQFVFHILLCVFHSNNSYTLVFRLPILHLNKYYIIFINENKSPRRKRKCVQQFLFTSYQIIRFWCAYIQNVFIIIFTCFI